MDDNEPRGEVSPQVIQALTKYLGGEENDSGPVYLDKSATYSTLEYVRELYHRDSAWKEFVGGGDANKLRREGLLELMLDLAEHFYELPRSMFVHVNKERGPYAFSQYTWIFRGALNGRAVAVKISLCQERYSQDDESWTELIPHLRKWHQIKHENVMELLSITVQPEFDWSVLSVVLPWEEHDDVREYMQKNPSDENQKNSWLRQAASGLNHLHMHDIVHGNVLGRNLMITSDGRAILTDPGLFAIACKAPDRWWPSRPEYYIYHPWQAPECLIPEDYKISGCSTKKSDVYSFAMLCYEVYAEENPSCFMGRSTRSRLMEKIVDGNRPGRVWSPTFMEEDVFALLEMCWHQDPEKRPDMSEVIANKSLGG